MPKYEYRVLMSRQDINVATTGPSRYEPQHNAPFVLEKELNAAAAEGWEPTLMQGDMDLLFVVLRRCSHG